MEFKLIKIIGKAVRYEVKELDGVKTTMLNVLVTKTVTSRLTNISRTSSHIEDIYLDEGVTFSFKNYKDLNVVFHCVVYKDEFLCTEYEVISEETQPSKLSNEI